MSPCWCGGKQMLKQLLRAEHVIPVKCNENLALNLFKSNHLQGIFEAGCKWKQHWDFFLPSAWGKVQQRQSQHWLEALVAGFRCHLCHECPLWPPTGDFVTVCAWVGQWNMLLVQDSTCRTNNKSKKIKRQRRNHQNHSGHRWRKLIKLLYWWELSAGEVMSHSSAPLPPKGSPCRAQRPFSMGQKSGKYHLLLQQVRLVEDVDPSLPMDW